MLHDNFAYDDFTNDDFIKQICSYKWNVNFLSQKNQNEFNKLLLNFNTLQANESIKSQLSKNEKYKLNDEIDNLKNIFEFYELLNKKIENKKNIHYIKSMLVIFLKKLTQHTISFPELIAMYQALPWKADAEIISAMIRMMSHMDSKSNLAWSFFQFTKRNHILSETVIASMMKYIFSFQEMNESSIKKMEELYNDFLSIERTNYIPFCSKIYGIYMLFTANRTDIKDHISKIQEIYECACKNGFNNNYVLSYKIKALATLGYIDLAREDYQEFIAKKDREPKYIGNIFIYMLSAEINQANKHGTEQYGKTDKVLAVYEEMKRIKFKL
ncbi:MAG: hypothetical protein JO149_03480, partial [Gammaproteobacteria bacterium]|nr:hypothetical protein [Gammaproteobacteria bacterium]